MNEEKHWNRIAPTYNEEIFDVFKSDVKKILPAYFKKFGNQKHNAIDFGCGNGKAFEFIAPLFKKVLGIDISQKLLDQAATLPYPNITLQQADLTKTIHYSKAEFVFCCNVAILPEVETNLAMIKNISKSLKQNGHAMVVIPSLESMIFSAWRMIDWYKKEGTTPEDIEASELSGFANKKTDILQGLVSINGVTTKHYTAPEVEIIFPRCGLEVIALEKVEYHWNSEFSSPPKWMHQPYPWDWLVVCTKK